MQHCRQVGVFGDGLLDRFVGGVTFVGFAEEVFNADFVGGNDEFDGVDNHAGFHHVFGNLVSSLLGQEPCIQAPLEPLVAFDVVDVDFVIGDIAIEELGVGVVDVGDLDVAFADGAKGFGFAVARIG